MFEIFGIRPHTRRKIGGRRALSSALSKLEKARGGESPVTAWSMGVHSSGSKYDETWEWKRGCRYPQRVRKKRGAVETIRAPDGDNGKEHLDALDYGDMWKVVIKTPWVYDREEIGVEFIEKGHVRITAPGFSKELPLLAPEGVNGSISWNYKNGVLEINQRK